MKSCFNGKPKAILVPYPAQGHVTPMLKLATQLLTLGLEPVVVTPEFIHSRLILPQIIDHDGIILMSIPNDGLEDGKPRDFFAIEMAMEIYMPSHLQKIVLQLKKQLLLQEEEAGVAFLVVDLLASYAFDVANQCGVKVAGFWPAMLATYRLIAAIPDMLDAGFISETGYPVHEASMFFPTGGSVQAAISAEELPWLIGNPSARKSRFKFWRRTIERSRSLRWLLVNTFPEEEEYCCFGGNMFLDSAQNHYNKYPLIIPIFNFHHDLQPINMEATINRNYMIMKRGISFWEEDSSCLDWLDKQSAGSVVYISFGSWVSPIGEAKLKSLALALESSGSPFLWVLGNAWRRGLPSGYMERVSKHEGRGKIVSWAPQVDVLQHVAVGSYLTHCGWNSTMEAIQCKKPLLCWPIAGDQFLNCAYIVKVWGIGFRIKGFGQRDLEHGLKMVMQEDQQDIIRNRIMKLSHRLMSKEASHSAVANLTTFIHSIRSTKKK